MWVKKREMATRRKIRKWEWRAGGKGRKGKIYYVCMRRRNGHSRKEIPANEVNMAYRHINLPNVLGCNEWGRKNWEEERSRITDTGFNGGGLCSCYWLSRYGTYLRSFYPKAKIIKNWKTPKICPHGRTGESPGEECSLTELDIRFFQTSEIETDKRNDRIGIMLYIIRELDIAVISGGNQFRDGRGVRKSVFKKRKRM